MGAEDSPNYAYSTSDASVKLADHGIIAENVKNLSGGEIKDGAIVPDAFPADVTYIYQCGNDDTIECTIHFLSGASAVKFRFIRFSLS